jgi:uncharacterized protein YcbX
VSGDEVGRVAALWRYPVKSMAPEALERVEVGWHGIVGDRRWAFLRPDQEHNGFPWLTIREQPALARYLPRLVDAGWPDATGVKVRTPAGVEVDVLDPALAAELGAARVMKLDRGAFDTLPLAVISSQTIASLAALVGRALDVRRFRPNILVDAAGGAAYPEDSWVGATIRIGELRIRIDKRDQRCVTVNIDPVTCERDSAILRTIGSARQAYLGVYGSVAIPGAIGVGDPVIVDWHSR